MTTTIPGSARKLSGSVADLEDKLRARIEPHLKFYAAEVTGTKVPCNEGLIYECPGNGTIDLDNDDWVLLRDHFSDDMDFSFNPSHRACAVAAWGEEHILG